MNYILLDLEWNSAFSKIHGRYVNEIIEIGAVKLNEKLREIDSFKVIIRSKLTKKLSGRFKNLTSISNEEMLGGVSFETGLEMYSDWAEFNDATMTWSNTDLYVLLENCRLFSHFDRIPCIKRYIDVQRFVQDEMRRRGIPLDNQQISLAKAAELMEIDTESMDLHRAESDSRLCCLLLQKTFHKDRLFALSEDTTASDYYDRLTYKPYIVSDINSPYVDKNTMKFCCDDCGNPARRTGKWIFKNRAFRAPFKCDSCGREFMGSVSFKKMYDSVSVKRSTGPIVIKKKTEVSNKFETS